MIRWFDVLTAAAHPVTIAADRTGSTHPHAVRMIQVFAVAAMVIPSDVVIKAIGAQGFAAALVGMFACAAYVATVLFGQHDPLAHRHPIRALLFAVWLSALASYVLMDRGMSTVAQAASADRAIMQLIWITGIALVAAEFLNSLEDIRRVLRALVWGGAFCGVVAALQYFLRLDVTPILRDLPGFTINYDNPSIVARGSLNRSAGTSITPIELGVVAGMLMPLAIHLALHDTARSLLRRWAPVALIGLGIAAAVSRSGIIAITLAFTVLAVLMPARQRLVALACAPFAVLAVFMSAHGLIGTLVGFFSSAKRDDSVLARLGDYPEAERLIREAPWLGHGPGTYLPSNMLYIFDNQYLKTAVELGAAGVVALLAMFVVPFLGALIARRRSKDPELRLLCAALAATTLAAGVCSFTFDSLSFPMYSSILALTLGLIGAAWRLSPAPRYPGGAPQWTS